MRIILFVFDVSCGQSLKKGMKIVFEEEPFRANPRAIVAWRYSTVDGAIVKTCKVVFLPRRVANFSSGDTFIGCQAVITDAVKFDNCADSQAYSEVNRNRGKAVFQLKQNIKCMQVDNRHSEIYASQ